MARLTIQLAAMLVLAATPASAGALDRWASPIAEAATRFGLPKRWIRKVMFVESGGIATSHGRPTVSPAGAMGLMQLMPGTWRDMQLMLGLGSDPFDPHDNILAGAAYLRLMYDRFGYPGMFAAYNAGPSRYAAFLALSRRLPAETRAYVKRLTQPAIRQRAHSYSLERTSALLPSIFGISPAPRSQTACFRAVRTVGRQGAIAGETMQVRLAN